MSLILMKKEPPKPRNFVAKHQGINKGGPHTDKKKEENRTSRKKDLEREIKHERE